LGDLNLQSDWDAQNNGIHMNGNITQKDADPTLIDGGIFLAKDSIHLNFDAHRLNVGFVHIWTDNILPDIHGRASGQLSLWGKFKGLNLTGNAFGEKCWFSGRLSEHKLFNERFGGIHNKWYLIQKCECVRHQQRDSHSKRLNQLSQF
jgi:hypothetical protein